MGAAETIHIVDDDEAIRDSLRFLLAQTGWDIRTYDSAKALILAQLSPAGCILTDFQMPEIDGLQLQARLADLGSRLPVIVMTGHGDIPIAVRAMKAGAVDFLEKPFAEQDLLNAVQRALEQNRQALAAAALSADAARRIARLTAREVEVLDHLVAGQSNKEIANALGASPRTIDVHRARVYQKLQTDTLPDLVRLVIAARSTSQS
jgi:two-component system response regulator FixJ